MNKYTRKCFQNFDYALGLWAE